MKFLQQVADYYLKSGADLHNMVFVFPNRRAAMYMRRYMRSAATDVCFLPRMVSVTWFVQSLADTALASRQELVFMLYRVYRRVLERHGQGDNIPDFDSFSFWGGILLNDFSEVDSSLADADQLFRNLSGLNEIEANYLTDEQIRAIELLWGRRYARHADTEGFWRHVPHGEKSGELSRGFIKLWMVMDELYREFRLELSRRRPVPLAYSGMQERAVLERVKGMSADDFGGRRYAFIGFSSLSTARTLIFQELRGKGIADFFWDTAFAAGLDPAHPALRFVMPLARRLPAPEGFEPGPADGPADVEIMSVPSSVAQAKVAASVIDDWTRPWLESLNAYDYQQRLLDTAVVLPEPQLMIPLLYSLPRQASPVNVTMGLPYSQTPFAAMMSSVVSMQLRARFRGDDCTYYYQDVNELLNNPYVVMLDPDQVLALGRRITREHMYRVSASMICRDYPALAPVFAAVGGGIDGVRSYLTALADTLALALAARAATVAPGRADDLYEMRVLEGYRRAVASICSLAQEYGLEMNVETFFRLIEHELAADSIDFVGEPLKGLQIMGMGDTRALDFDNIVILSMNEGVFPRRNYTPSLIPAALRHGYHMPTQEHEESADAYRLYRLISRASRVKMLYDSRAKGLASGEMSRYLSQFLHLDKSTALRLSSWQLPAVQPEPRDITIDKTMPGVAEALARFRPGGDRFLSASALKTYIKCPLCFYLEYVKGLGIKDVAMEYIDAASYGTVLHSMAEHLYKPYEGQWVTAEVIDHILKTRDLEALALEELDQIYYKGLFHDRLGKMPGEGRVLARMMARLIRTMLREDAKAAPFVFVAAEFDSHVGLVWKISDKLTVQWHMSIDRIDRLPDGSLRFIDYKTGGDKLSATSIENLINDTSMHGILQLLVYCHAYADIHGFDGPIKPMIYKFQDMAKEGIPDLKLSKVTLTDYRLADSGDTPFRQVLEDLIGRIFETDNQYPFTQAPLEEQNKVCLYCHFKQLCGRNPENPDPKMK